MGLADRTRRRGVARPRGHQCCKRSGRYYTAGGVRHPGLERLRNAGRQDIRDRAAVTKRKHERCPSSSLLRSQRLRSRPARRQVRTSHRSTPIRTRHRFRPGAAQYESPPLFFTLPKADPLLLVDARESGLGSDSACRIRHYHTDAWGKTFAPPVHGERYIAQNAQLTQTFKDGIAQAVAASLTSTATTTCSLRYERSRGSDVNLDMCAGACPQAFQGSSEGARRSRRRRHDPR